MQLAELLFVTSNQGKLREAEAVLGCRLAHRGLELDELQSLELEQVVRHKAAEAYRLLRAPVLVEDTSLELAGLGGFPGPLVRWLLASVGPAGICRIAGCFENRSATARCIAFATDGVAEAVGAGVVAGTIVESRAVAPASGGTASSPRTAAAAAPSPRWRRRRRTRSRIAEGPSRHSEIP